MCTASLVLFQQRKPAMQNQDWNQKLPDFVQRLEEALYRTATSKEEYQNYGTLESRLQSVARKMVSRGGSRPGEAAVPAGTPWQQLTPQQRMLVQQQQVRPAYTPREQQGWRVAGGRREVWQGGECWR